MTVAQLPANKAVSSLAIFAKWHPRHSRLLLAALTLACLLPFSGKAFHMDDPLFLWTAQHVAQHPLDPYGFRVVWYATDAPVADVTKNPPLAAYYLACFGRFLGWSEHALHIAFLLPALAAILATYRLADRFTRFPLLAAAATLFTPGFLVSATTVMCDVLMLALWLLALVLWLEGMESAKPGKLALAAVLVAACALTKYFGIALLPVLLAYCLIKRRRLDRSLAYLAIPVVLLALYQYWTHGLYGRGLLSDAVQYASLHSRGHELPVFAKALVGLVFSGGCFVPAFFFAPFLWTRRAVFAALAVAGAAGLAASSHSWSFQAPQASQHWAAVSVQMAVLIAAGISAVALSAGSLRTLDAEGLLLSLWLLGTLFFAAFVNWTINARSILPMIPAAAIFIARKLETARSFPSRRFFLFTTAALFACAVFSLWVSAADAGLANTGRLAATRLSEEARESASAVYFEGHWGFQYYMQQLGAKPVDLRSSPFHAGDIVIIPENTTNSFGPPPGFVLSAAKIVRFDLRQPLATMSQPLGAGFYASVWGPLPFAFGEVPPERYLVARLSPAPVATDPPPLIFKRE